MVDYGKDVFISYFGLHGWLSFFCWKVLFYTQNWDFDNFHSFGYNSYKTSIFTAVETATWGKKAEKVCHFC